MSTVQNRYPGPCDTCGEMVRAGEGLARSSRLVGWWVYHRGACERAEQLWRSAGFKAAKRDGRLYMADGRTEAVDVLREWLRAEEIEETAPHQREALRLAVAKCERIAARRRVA